MVEKTDAGGSKPPDNVSTHIRVCNHHVDRSICMLEELQSPDQQE
jgi:hypothetical protein